MIKSLVPFLVILNITCLAQVSPDKLIKFDPSKGTTDQEYTYVTNGISTSISSALDIKSGYSINGNKNFAALEGSDYVSGDYNFRFATLEREADKTVAAIIVKLVSEYHHKTFWFCIPINNEILFKKFTSSLTSSLGEESTTAFAFALIGYFLDSKLPEANTVSKDSNDKVFQIVEQQPEFPGGEKALTQYLKDCPPIDNKTEGSIYVRFIVENNGKISNVEIAKGTDQKLKEAALECVKKMPDWKPGKQNGKPVRVQYIVHIFDN